VFFAVTFAITWGFWLSAIAFDVGTDTAAGVVWLLLGLTGPGVAGVGLVYLLYDENSRKEFWNRVWDFRRIGGRWYLVILLYAPVAVAIAALIDVLLGGGGATYAAWVPQLSTNLVAFLPTLFFATLPPILEELGWRGYALDQLQRTRSALASGLILGIVWSIWHLPLFFIEGTYQHDVVGFLTMGFWLFMVGIVPLSVAFTWIHNGTGGSILASVLLHSWVNFTVQTIELTPRADVFFYTVVLFGFVALVTAIWGADILASTDEIPHPTLETKPTGR
jgi:membrane protease YdiL (CAAX protease family)